MAKQHKPVAQAKDAVTEASSGAVKHLMQSAGETATRVAHHTRDAGRSLTEYTRVHPLQVALAAGCVAGAAWWLLRDRRHAGWHGAAEGWQDHGGYATYEERGRERVRDAVNGVRNTVNGVRNTVADVRDTVADVRDTVGEYAADARQRWRRAGSSVDHFVHESPLVAGAIALAIGAAIGLAAPSTRIEDRTLGSARDLALDQAARAARDLKDSVRDTIRTAAAGAPDATA